MTRDIFDTDDDICILFIGEPDEWDALLRNGGASVEPVAGAGGSGGSGALTMQHDNALTCNSAKFAMCPYRWRGRRGG